jgi:ABC-type multidrug transport system ATPase subunit/ABC-type multidrug transport system permease subunit
LAATAASASATSSVEERLRAEAVGLAVSGRRILKRVTVELRRGELLAMIGPSGSGKTTLLRVLAGVIEPSEGTVRLGREPVTTRSTEIGYLPDHEVVHASLTVVDVLQSAAALRLPSATPPERALERVSAVIAEMRLDHRANSRVRSLSGGERRRVACAVELIASPAMLLLDEPASGLDPSLERRLMRLLRQIADQGRGVAVVTHAISSLEHCDTVVVLAPGGRLAFLGPPRDALVRFGVSSYDEIYDALERDESGREPAAEQAPSGSARVRRPRPPSPQPVLPQAGTLAGRYLRCLLADRRTLAALLIQAPAIGALIGVVLPHDVLLGSALAPFYSVLLSFLLLTGSIWLGVFSSCREIVKEWPILERESAAGVRLDAYMLSKVVVLFPLVAAQVVLLCAVELILQPIGQPSSDYLQVILLCVLAGWAAAGFGLVLSAYARSSDQAIALVPLLLIPQLLFAGAIVPNAQMPSAVRALSDITFARWALAGLGNAVGASQKLASASGSIAGYDPGFFSLRFGGAAAALGIFICVGLIATAYAVERQLSSWAER